MKAIKVISFLFFCVLSSSLVFAQPMMLDGSSSTDDSDASPHFIDLGPSENYELGMPLVVSPKQVHPKLVDDECHILTCQWHEAMEPCYDSLEECSKKCEYIKFPENIITQDDCFYQLAVYEDPEYCEKIKDDKDRTICNQSFGIGITCDDYGSQQQKDSCYYNQAIEENDPEICALLSRPTGFDSKLECYLNTKTTKQIKVFMSISAIWVVLIVLTLLFSILRLSKSNLYKIFTYSSLILSGLVLFIIIFARLYDLLLKTLYEFVNVGIDLRVREWLFIIVMVIPIISIISLIFNKKNYFTIFNTIINYIFIPVAAYFAYYYCLVYLIYY